MGMNDDLISRKATIEYLMTNMGWYDEDGYQVDDADAKRTHIEDLINGIPTVPAAHVVHGQWEYIPEDGKFRAILICSKCKKCVGEYDRFDYCPHCGAKMDRVIGCG